MLYTDLICSALLYFTHAILLVYAMCWLGQLLQYFPVISRRMWLMFLLLLLLLSSLVSSLSSLTSSSPLLFLLFLLCRLCR
jgi:hypothetical protein